MGRWIRVNGISGVSDLLMDINDILSIVANPECVSRNRKRLAGMNGMVLEDWNGQKYIAQISGYNGNLGMYGYLVQPNNTLERFC